MDKIDELLTRGVANIIPSRVELARVLRSDKKLNIYLGIDPTSVHIHLGHATHLGRLQTLANLGHHVTFIIGDFTALVGDTSDKDSERPILTPKEIENNWQTYKSQAEKIVDFSKIEIHHNSEWLDNLNAQDFLKLIYQFSLNDFTSRELIKKRLDSGSSVRLPEAIYPALQGYDSWHLDTDIQLGGADQTFNMQAGRTLQKSWRNKESFVLVGQYLTGTDGRKMSKSWGNAIWLDDQANDIFGKVMSVGDGLIDQYFLLTTNLPQSEFPKDAHPMQRKKKLAWQIVSELHSSKTADEAQQNFEQTFQEGQVPKDIPTYHLERNRPLVEILVATGLAKSKSEARRLIDQNGVKLNQVTVADPEKEVGLGDIVRVGRKYVKITS